MNDYEPKPRRNSMRYVGFDYTSPGAYWITICTFHGHCIFGQIPHHEMLFTKIGQIAENCWLAIPEHHPQVVLDNHVVMPNHIHGTLWVVGENNVTINESSDADEEFADIKICDPKSLARKAFKDTNQDPVVRKFGQPIAGSPSTIIGSYKAAVSREVNKLEIQPGPMCWHRNFWDHIVRDGKDLDRFRSYMSANPARWLQDKLHPDAPLNKFNSEWREEESE